MQSEQQRRSSTSAFEEHDQKMENSMNSKHHALHADPQNLEDNLEDEEPNGNTM
jgi:hypothetical protein